MSLRPYLKVVGILHSITKVCSYKYNNEIMDNDINNACIWKAKNQENKIQKRSARDNRYIGIDTNAEVVVSLYR